MAHERAVSRTAKDSKQPDTLGMLMAAVINQLVAQQETFHSMMMETHSAMTGHMRDHKELHDTKGAMEHSMMETAKAPEPKAEATNPKV